MQKIAKKFVEVMRDCSHVAKNDTNDFHKYKYATAADVLENAKSRTKKARLQAICQVDFSFPLVFQLPVQIHQRHSV